MIILGIETSCDDTSIAIVEDGEKIHRQFTASQHDLHKKYNGIVPEVASRAHLQSLLPLLDEVLTTADISISSIDAIAVTSHPGLIGSLLTGINTAKTLAYHLQIPLIPISHLKAHFYALTLSTPITYPYVGLLVSGGHTLLAISQSPLGIEVIGCTLDDACGECFDKVAKHFEIGYPGGPAIEQLAKSGNEDAYRFPKTHLNGKDTFDFSYSGLKTAVIYHHQKYLINSDQSFNLADLAASFQKTALSGLVEKSVKAAGLHGLKEIGVCGGVSANQKLKTYFKEAEKQSIKVHFPDFNLCTDNAGMIAGLAYEYYKANPSEFQNLPNDIFQVSASAKSFKASHIL